MNSYLIFILAVIIGTYVLEIVAELLNLKHISPVLPDEFNGWYDADKYKASQLYLEKNTALDLVNKTFFTIAILVFILAGGFNSVDLIARSFGSAP